MKPLFTSVTLAAWMVALPAPVFAAEPSAGQQDYEIRCAMCHGGGGCCRVCCDSLHFNGFKANHFSIHLTLS